MPFFKETIVEEPPTLFESSIAYLNNAVSTIEKSVPTPDDLQLYVDKIVENKIFLLTALFVLCSIIVLCAPLASAVKEMKQQEIEKKQVQEKEQVIQEKKQEEALQVHEETKQLVEMLDMDEKELAELLLRSSNNANDDIDDDASSSDESAQEDQDDDGDVSDDASVEETYNDFLLKVTDSKDEEEDGPLKVFEDDSATAQDDDVSDVSMLTETPVASPPGTPERRGSGSSKGSGGKNNSTRSSLRKRLSVPNLKGLSKRTLSFKNLTAYGQAKKMH